MLIHVEHVQIELCEVRLEKLGEAVDHIRPDSPYSYLLELV
jgi:hypothetical protein